MKVILSKPAFLASWAMAERCSAARTAAGNSAFSAVKFTADDYEATLRATNIRTSITVRAGGVTVVEPGAAVLPVKGVSELFAKAPGGEMTLETSRGAATLSAEDK